MMIKRKRIHCCSECCGNLFSRGEMIALFYGDICLEYANKNQTMVLSTEKGSGVPEMIKVLERDNFVVSTEVSKNCLSVKPLNHHYSKTFGHFYCSKIDEHRPEFME